MPDAITLDRLREVAGGRILLRQGEAMAVLDFTHGRLLQEIGAGRLRYVPVGKRRRFKVSELAAYIERQEQQGCPEDHSSSGAPGRHIGTRTSKSTVVDFETALKRTQSRKPKQKLLSYTPTPGPGGPSNEQG